MKNLKIIIIATTIAILTVATIGVALAHNYGGSSYYGGMMGYSTPYEDEDWWIEMREHMDEHWDEIQDEEWYNDMRTYMDEHIEDVENQDWFDEMTQFMEDQRYEYRYHFDSGYGYGYHDGYVESGEAIPQGQPMPANGYVDIHVSRPRPPPPGSAPRGGRGRARAPVRRARPPAGPTRRG